MRFLASSQSQIFYTYLQTMRDWNLNAVLPTHRAFDSDYPARSIQVLKERFIPSIELQQNHVGEIVLLGDYRGVSINSSTLLEG